MDAILELQILREALIQEIDEKIEQMIKKLQNMPQELGANEHMLTRSFESIYPLNVGTGIYKGKRPTAIIFADCRRIESPTWKRVMEEILKDCCKNPENRQALMNLRGKVLGRNRVLVDSEPGKMRSPVKIEEALYVETHYDTETLLKILTNRILDKVGYNYSGIKIAVRAE